MKLVIQIPEKKYQPGIEDKIRKIVEDLIQEEIRVRVINRGSRTA